MSNSNKVSAILVFICLVSFGNANVDQDRAQCADQLVGLAECLPYVGGDAKTPTIDCCTGIKEVVQRSKKCLCILIKDHDDPNLGLKINVTRAVQLPTACHVPINISTCVDILKLPSSSPDAKMFQDYENKTEASNRTAHTPSGALVSQEKSNGGNQLGLGGGFNRIEVLFGTSLWFYMIHLVFWV